jgi:hypothetical protein
MITKKIIYDKKKSIYFGCNPDERHKPHPPPPPLAPRLGRIIFLLILLPFTQIPARQSLKAERVQKLGRTDREPDGGVESLRKQSLRKLFSAELLSL